MSVLLRRRDEVAALLLLGASMLVFTRALGTRTNYDEGVYLASLDTLRRGGELGSDVYTSQPPVFYWVLRLLASPFGSSVDGIRLGFAVLALVGVAAAAALVSRLHGAIAGAAAGAFLAIGPPFPTVAPTVSADVPAVALGLGALALLAVALHSRSPVPWGAVAGAVLMAAVLTKLLAAPFVVPFLALAITHRTRRAVLPAAAAGALGLAAVVAAVHVRSLDAIWESVVSDHTGASALGSYGENARWIADQLEPRTPIAWLVLAGAVCFVASKETRRLTWHLWTLVPASALFLVLVRPLADHHLVLMSAAYAVSAGPSLALGVRRLRGRRLAPTVAAVVVLFVVAGLYQEQRRLRRNDVAEPVEVTWAVEAVRAATQPDAIVVSDQPIVGFLARRAMPGPLVDTSNTRITGGGLTPDEVIAAIETARPAVVVVARMFRTLPEVLAFLGERYPVQASCGAATIYGSSAAASAPVCPS